MSNLDLSEYLSDDSLTLTGIPSAAHPAAEGGGSYTIPSLSAEDGVRLQLFLRVGPVPDKNATAKQRATYAKEAAAASNALREFLAAEDDNQPTLQQKLFGPAYDQMLADGVSHNVMEKLAQVVVTQVASGFEMAERVVSHAVGEAKARAEAMMASVNSGPVSSPQVGSKSSPASSVKSTRSTPAQASTRARKTSARKPAKKAAPVRKTA